MRDEEIIQLLKTKQEHKAFVKLYGYLPVVQKYICANGGKKNDAVDVYQDALVILCEKIEAENFKLTSSLNSFVFGIARLLWHEELRRQGKMNLVSAEKVDFITDEDLNLEDRELKNERAQSALAELGKRCLQLLQLFYGENKSMKEIAVKMGFGGEKIAKNQKYKCLEKAREKYMLLQKSKTH